VSRCGAACRRAASSTRRPQPASCSQVGRTHAAWWGSLRPRRRQGTPFRTSGPRRQPSPATGRLGTTPNPRPNALEPDSARSGIQPRPISRNVALRAGLSSIVVRRRNRRRGLPSRRSRVRGPSSAFLGLQRFAGAMRISSSPPSRACRCAQQALPAREQDRRNRQPCGRTRPEITGTSPQGRGRGLSPRIGNQ
jgi:hypothetical protein